LKTFAKIAIFALKHQPSHCGAYFLTALVSTSVAITLRLCLGCKTNKPYQFIPTSY